VLQLAPLPNTAAWADDSCPATATTAAAATSSSYSSVEAIKQAIQKDFVTGQYYVTGQLTPALYEPDCLFTDPTTSVKGEQRPSPPHQHYATKFLPGLSTDKPGGRCVVQTTFPDTHDPQDTRSAGFC
jgi:hypothetical protein